MKQKALYLLVALAVAGVGAANAQSTGSSDASGESSQTFDDRWFIAPTFGGWYNDESRNTNSRQPYWGIGFGKFVSPKVSLEAYLDHTSRDRDLGGSWNTTGLGMSARFFPGNFEKWRPYVMLGMGGNRYHAGGDRDWAATAQVGVGTQVGFGEDKNNAFRMELGYRYGLDDNTLPQHDGYGDWMLGLSLLHRFGEPPAPPAPPAAPPPPPEPDCSQLDDDNDGVNNCLDKCPNSAAGSIVGPDGCPKPVIIDLRGVNFKFDRPSKGETDIAATLKEPTEDSMAILKQAVDTLQRYPAVKVELDGYTDSVGSEAYNQKLSERRAQIVYEYLTGNGIDASRITAVKGFGESNPIAPNDDKDGRSRNRRTELVVQNPEQPAAPADKGFE